MSLVDLAVAKERVKCGVRSRPAVYYGMHRLRGKHLDVAVSQDTQLVIEGFPRCGNTFAVVAFQQAQKCKPNLAHHLHVPARVIRAARWGIPALVLIRNPVDVVTSLMIRHPRITGRRALFYYASFHEAVAGYRDAYVLGRFEEVTEDYGKVIERVNGRFGTAFAPFESTEESTSRIFSRIETIPRARGEETLEHSIPRPSVTREERKSSLKKELEALEAGRLLSKAEAVYEELAK